MTNGIRISLTGSLAFCAILVIVGAWKDIDILWVVGMGIGVIITLVNLFLRIAEYEKHY